MAKVLVTLDDRLLARIDREARALGLTRSGYLARLAARELDVPRGPGRQARVKKALTRLERLFESAGAEDATQAIRRERDAR